MTDSEKYLVIGQVVSEHEKTKLDLAAARAKACNLGDLLRAFGAALTFWNGLGRPGTDSRSYAGYDVKDGKIQATYDHRSQSGAWPSFAEVEELTKEIQNLEAAELALRQRRKELGAGQ